MALADDVGGGDKDGGRLAPVVALSPDRQEQQIAGVVADRRAVDRADAEAFRAVGDGGVGVREGHAVAHRVSLHVEPSEVPCDRSRFIEAVTGEYSATI